MMQTPRELRLMPMVSSQSWIYNNPQRLLLTARAALATGCIGEGLYLQAPQELLLMTMVSSQN